jgi:hypothetical protein
VFFLKIATYQSTLEILYVIKRTKEEPKRNQRGTKEEPKRNQRGTKEEPKRNQRGVGRRGTNQLRLLERYLDILVKHTTEIPPPTALVEDVSLR